MSITKNFRKASSALLSKRAARQTKKRRSKTEKALRKQKVSRQDFQEATIESPCPWPRPLAAAIRAEATVDKQKERYKILCLYLFQQFEELLKRKMPGVKKTIPLLTPDWRLLACGLTAMGMDRTKLTLFWMKSAADLLC